MGGMPITMTVLVILAILLLWYIPNLIFIGILVTLVIISNRLKNRRD